MGTFWTLYCRPIIKYYIIIGSSDQGSLSARRNDARDTLDINMFRDGCDWDLLLDFEYGRWSEGPIVIYALVDKIMVKKVPGFVTVHSKVFIRDNNKQYFFITESM